MCSEKYDWWWEGDVHTGGRGRGPSVAPGGGSPTEVPPSRTAARGSRGSWLDAGHCLFSTERGRPPWCPGSQDPGRDVPFPKLGSGSAVVEVEYDGGTLRNPHA